MTAKVDIAKIETHVGQVLRILPEKTFDLIYGAPGSGKSRLIYLAMRQALRENPGKKLKVILGDGSGATYSALVRAGKAEVCEFMQRPWPLDVLNKLTAGWWLKDRNDPTSELIPADPHVLNEFCGTSWEGASVMGKYLLGSVEGGFSNQAANGVSMGPDPIVKVMMGKLDGEGNLVDGPGTMFGTNGTAHYMAAQGHLVDFIQRSRSLPGHHWWTAHEVVMDDFVNIGDLKNPIKVKQNVVLGVPEAAGKALGPNLQRIFNNTLHCQPINKQGKDDEKNELTGNAEISNDILYRFYTRDHFPQIGATNVKWKACTRNVGTDFPAYFDGEDNALEYYRALKAVEDAELAKILAE